MKGKHRVTVQNKRIRYDFEIKRNITIIRGDSATGKTALVDMIREYYENGVGSGVELKCDKTCVVLEGRNWETILSTVNDSIVFIDEGNEFVASVDFASVIQRSDNYYVIVAREVLATLPYSGEEIYGIRDSGKYGSLKRTYNELYHLYGEQKFITPDFPDVVITEDSNAGFQFFQNVCDKEGQVCLSANGKSNIFSMLIEQKVDRILVIADGAAFGAEMEKLMRLAKTDHRFALYLPESFEWLILQSGVVNSGEIKEMLKNPEDYIESKEYFSWEQFFTQALIRETEGGYLKYSKRTLNPVYLHENIKGQILESICKNRNF